MSKGLSKFAAALVIYTCFAVYLFLPYLKSFAVFQYLYIFNCCLAAVGAFLLSCRWTGSFWGRLLSGTLYGFGPFMLGLCRFHPAVGFLAAAVGWLFLPAVLAPDLFGRRYLQIPLSTLPFLFILFCFELFAYLRLFPAPVQSRLNLVELAGAFTPLVMAQNNLTLTGCYHIPTAALAIGTFMLVAARRFGIVLIFAAGLTAGFCPAVLNTSPIIWLAFPALCCSVLAGLGLQGLLSASEADRKWLLLCAAGLSVLSLGTLLPATRFFHSYFMIVENTLALVQTAKLYAAGAVTVFLVYFIVRSGLRLTALRAALLGTAMVIDIFLGARFIIDSIF